MVARGAPPEAAHERLREHARALGVEIDGAAMDDLSTFLDELELWNARTNLVGEHARETLIDRHLVDALAAVPLLQALGDGLRIADLGSGAGLPGIPLAIALRPREMVLVEPRRKRASFLRAVRRRLGALPISVVEGRAEDVAGASEGSFDAVVSRAALTDEELPVVGAPFLRHGGLLIAYRGASGAAPSGAMALEIDGYGPLQVHHYELAGPRRRFALLVRERLRFT